MHIFNKWQLILTTTKTKITTADLSWSSGNGFAVGAAAVLVGVAGAVGKVRTFGRSKIVRTTSKLGRDAATALEVLALRRCDVIYDQFKLLPQLSQKRECFVARPIMFSVIKRSSFLEQLKK